MADKSNISRLAPICDDVHEGRNEEFADMVVEVVPDCCFRVCRVSMVVYGNATTGVSGHSIPQDSRKCIPYIISIASSKGVGEIFGPRQEEVSVVCAPRESGLMGELRLISKYRGHRFAELGSQIGIIFIVSCLD